MLIEISLRILLLLSCLQLAWTNTSLKIYLYDLPEFRRLHNEIVAADPRHESGDGEDQSTDGDSCMDVPQPLNLQHLYS